MLTAVAVSLSTFAVPIGASKCFPIQHLCNVMAGVFLGPWYGVGMAFCTSLIRNLMGTGSLLAFPGSMVGAYLCGMLYRHSHKLMMAMWERCSAPESWARPCVSRWRLCSWARRWPCSSM